MTKLNRIKFLTEEWGEETVEKILNAAFVEYCEISMKNFLQNCTPCGGNWGGMLLSGIHVTYPEVYDAIPDKMGCNAFACICDVMNLCGVLEDKE